MWYYALGTQQHGPIAREQIEALVAQGHIRPADLVWTEGMPEWLPAAQVFPNIAPPVGAPALPIGHLGYFNPSEHRPEFVFAGFWIRFCAVFIDGILLYVVGQLAIAIMSIMGGANLGSTLFSGIGRISTSSARPRTLTHADVVVGSLAATFNFLLGVSYEVALITLFGATLGKMAVGIKVVRTSGERIGVGRSIGRHFAKYLSQLILLIGYIMAAFTKKRQGLHDIITDTIVIKVK